MVCSRSIQPVAILVVMLALLFFRRLQPLYLIIWVLGAVAYQLRPKQASIASIGAAIL